MMRKKVISIFYLSVLSALSAKSAVQTLNRYATRLADAKQSNNAISGTENYIQNTKWTNALLLKTLEYGRDTLSLGEISQLETLAKSCPAVEGLGVYKARVLYAYYEPIVDYDDYATCNPQNKNGNALFNDLLIFLNNPNSNENKEVVTGVQQYEQYKVYPIPTTEQLTIEYDFVGDGDAEVILIDLLGREVLRTTLKNSNTKVLIPVGHLNTGIYMFNISVGTEKYTGKILKQ
jgi:hypothetical protein